MVSLVQFVIVTEKNIIALFIKMEYHEAPTAVIVNNLKDIDFVIHHIAYSILRICEKLKNKIRTVLSYYVREVVTILYALLKIPA